MLKIIEFFAGSRSISKEAEKTNCQVFSTDIIAFNKINYVIDVFDFDFERVPFIPDVLWFSPPCTAFSVAAIGRNWTKVAETYIPKTIKAEIGISMLKKCLDIIAYYQKINPKIIFFIENPRGMMRKMPHLENITRHTVTYCQYGDTRMKPTDIWTNCKSFVPKKCNNGDTCHIAAPRGSKTGTQGLKNAFERSKIPPLLCADIVESCIKDCLTQQKSVV